MKTLSTLLVFTFSLTQAVAQKAPETWQKAITGDWKMDSIHTSKPSERWEELSSLTSSAKVSFKANKKMVIVIEDEPVILEYDLSQSATGKYINIQGGFMVYLEVVSVNTTGMTLRFEVLERVPTSVFCFFSREKWSADSSYEFLEEQYYEDRPEQDTLPAAKLQLLPEGQVIFDFGVSDTGTWKVDNQSLTLTLIGKVKTYRFEINRYMDKHLSLTPQKAVGLKSVYHFGPAPWWFEEEVGAVTEMIEPMTESSEEFYYDTPIPEPVEENVEPAPPIVWSGRIETYGNIWQMDGLHPEIAKDKTVTLKFEADGEVWCHVGKKKHKGTWKRRDDGELVVNWGEQEELIRSEWHYDGSFYLTFRLPGTESIHKHHFKPIIEEQAR